LKNNSEDGSRRLLKGIEARDLREAQEKKKVILDYVV
jgi:hypothetical protein